MPNVFTIAIGAVEAGLVGTSAEKMAANEVKSAAVMLAIDFIGSDTCKGFHTAGIDEVKIF